MRLHRGGRWRTWLGAALGGDADLGDRAWRRILHAGGAFVVVYYLLPSRLFVVVSNEQALLLALAAVLALEVARWGAGLELPTIRPHEVGRPASFAYYAVGLVAAVLLFARPVAVAVVIGGALVDPLLGEMRVRRIAFPWNPLAGIAAYFALALPAMIVAGGWTLWASAAAALLAALAAVAVERPRIRYLDDDLTMILVPGVLLSLLLLGAPGFPGLGG